MTGKAGEATPRKFRSEVWRLSTDIDGEFKRFLFVLLRTFFLRPPQKLKAWCPGKYFAHSVNQRVDQRVWA